MSAIALGSYFSCALGKDRLVRCWGKNQVGQLGIGSVETVGTGGMGTSIQTVNIGSDGMKLNFSPSRGSLNPVEYRSSGCDHRI